MHQPADHLASIRAESSHQCENRWLSWTYGQLKDASLRLARGMLKAGVERGSTLATVIPDGIESELLLWVSAILQLTLAALDVGLLSAGREDQLKEYVTRISPQTAVFPDANSVALFNQALQTLGIGVNLRLILEGTSSGWTPLEEMAAAGPLVDIKVSGLAQDAALEQGGNRIAVILFMSGTLTGRLKGCPLKVRGLLNGTLNACCLEEVPPRCRLVWLCVPR